ncbi:MAG: flagellar protein FlgN [Oscillospiraceae bacterium]|nr:flagellar protein FlgN [Oscillospiraceae bacterium]
MVEYSKQLLEVLNEQLDVCKKYLDIQNKKTEIIVIGDIQKLDLVVREEQSFVMRMESFEKKRTQLLANCGLETLTISEIIRDYVEEESKQDYTTTFDDLSDIIHKLNKVNDLNQRLLKQRLTVVDAVLAQFDKGNQVSTSVSEGKTESSSKPYINKIKRA